VTSRSAARQAARRRARRGGRWRRCRTTAAAEVAARAGEVPAESRRRGSARCTRRRRADCRGRGSSIRRRTRASRRLLPSSNMLLLRTVCPPGPLDEKATARAPASPAGPEPASPAASRVAPESFMWKRKARSRRCGRRSAPKGSAPRHGVRLRQAPRLRRTRRPVCKVDRPPSPSLLVSAACSCDGNYPGSETLDQE
jgi:hypothetical protein